LARGKAFSGLFPEPVGKVTDDAKAELGSSKIQMNINLQSPTRARGYGNHETGGGLLGA
jgi:hypothetical protein